MGRPIFSYELGDPDFSWLISNFQENFPQYSFIESSGLPVVFIEDHEGIVGERLIDPGLMNSDFLDDDLPEPVTE